jgi:hypothetical protein
MTIAVERDQVAQMYEIAHDHELGVLDELAQRAGLRWTCQPKPEHPHEWSNHPDEPCGRCGRTKTEAAVLDAPSGAAMSGLATAAHSASVALTEYRVGEKMRFSDGWMLKHFEAELRDRRAVFGFVLEAWRSAEDQSFDHGDEVLGHIVDGEVTVEQHT